MEELTIAGVKMPPIAYNGFTKSRNKVWSSNTGRNAETTMVGTLLSVKTKYEITFAPLTEEQVELVESVISNLDNAFSEVVFKRNSGKVDRFIAYSGDISYPLLWDRETSTLYNGVKVSLIEQ